MQMKAIILSLVLTVSATAQITVEQSFVDAANVAFKEVVALRTANDALIKANKANADAVEAYKFVNELLKADNADLRKLKCDSGSILFVYRWKRCK
jgi:hypothetical protein